MHSFYNLVYIRMASILPVLVCVEITIFLILYRKKGSTLRGQNMLLCGIVCFLVVAISNLLTSFGFFLITVGPEDTFTIHPLIFWGQTPVFLLGCLTCGIGACRWYLNQVRTIETSVNKQITINNKQGI